ncbi:hypothetical protein [Nitrosopumilus sp.]|uniref:hypothetical protein n=1 Tax=Nitrosopumilus sp. TaxID=2024843 RepID=UPI0034A02C43
MDSKIAMFSILALAAIFAMALPMDSVYAQTSDIIPDGEDEEYEGKSCPSKNKTASIQTGLNI